jgi:hypothetical protein
MKRKHIDALLGIALAIIFVATLFSLFTGCEEHHHRTVIVPSHPAPRRNTNINISPTVITPVPYYRTPTYYPLVIIEPPPVIFTPAPYCPPPVVVAPCPPSQPAPCPEPHHPEHPDHPHHDH